jgi:hypothetical protein
MKTITEIFGPNMLAHIKAYQEVISGGKTPEEAGAAYGEAHKLEGDKLKHVLNAIEIVKDRGVGLKRVLVMQVGETEKAPSNAVKKDEFHYLLEYFPKSASETKPRRDERDDKRGGRGGRDKKRGDRREGREGGGRDQNRAPHADQPKPTGVVIVTGVSSSAPGSAEKPAGGDRPRRQRPPRERKPRPEPAPVDPSRITGRIIPRAEFEKMKGEGAASVAVAAVNSSTEGAAVTADSSHSE